MKTINMVLFVVGFLVFLSGCMLPAGTICFVNQDDAIYQLYIDGDYETTIYQNNTYYYDGCAPGDYYCQADEIMGGSANTSGWVSVSSENTSFFYINEY